MAAQDSGGAAARLPKSFQQTDDRDARGRRELGLWQESFLFMDDAEAVRTCTASASSQTSRPVFTRIRCPFRAQAKRSHPFVEVSRQDRLSHIQTKTGSPAVIPTVLISSPENAYLIISRLPFEKSSLGL